MANEQSGCPLRRWRQFYGAFVAIDEAIEAAGHPRATFQDVRVEIVKLLRAATEDGVAEQLCAALDDAMVESLKTLKVVPVPHSALASTDLARVVRDLGKHGSARIRSLACDVVRGWRMANDVATAAAVKEFDKLSGVLIRCQGISTMPIVAQSKKLEAKKPVVLAPEAKKQPLITENEKMESEKMESTKRKLREGYEEAKQLKRQHTIQKIEDKEAPRLLERSLQKMHKGPARCRTSSGVRRPLLPALQLI